jgi:hypothetical protein
MSKFLKPNMYNEPKWVYMANPKTGEALKESRDDVAKIRQHYENGYGRTRKEVYLRYYRQGPIKSSFPVWLNWLGHYLPSNIYLNS